MANKIARLIRPATGPYCVSHSTSAFSGVVMTQSKHTLFSDMFWASLVLGMIIAQAWGGEKSGPNVIKETEKPSATPTDVQTVTLAGQLAAWATANHDAVAMAAAARVLAADP